MSKSGDEDSDSGRIVPRSLVHIWEYAAGGKWTALTEDPLEQFDCGTDWAEGLGRAGYASGGDYSSVVVYEALKQTALTERWGFLVEISPNESGVFLVFVADLPALIELLPAVYAMQAAGHLARLEDLVEQAAAKAFRAWHGHSLNGICGSCDPDAVERRRERKGARR